MSRTKYVDVTLGKEVYKVPTAEYQEDADGLSAVAGILVKLHQRVEELERQVDDMRSIVGYGDER